MRKIVLIAHDIRSTHNVGSILRTAEGLGLTKVYLTGYTPYPHHQTDARLPHESQKIHKQISKTALGAEDSALWAHKQDVSELIARLKEDGYSIVALEQSKGSSLLPSYKPSDKVVLLLGREVEGIAPEFIKLADTTLEIPMFGQKESFNVVQAAAMACYHIKFFPF